MNEQKKNDRVTKMIEYGTWIFAKTYAKSSPHEYALLKTHPELKDDFMELARCIFEEGYDEWFYGRRYKYLKVGDFKYWSMDRTIETTDLINRVPYDESNVESWAEKRMKECNIK